MTDSFPYRIFSDIHWGHSSTRLKALEDLLPLCPSTHTIIFNGDSIEEHLPDIQRRAIRLQWDQFVAKLPKSPLVLTGNHDPSISNLDHLVLPNNVFIHHGDGLYANPTPWIPGTKDIPQQPTLTAWLTAVRQQAIREFHGPEVRWFEMLRLPGLLAVLNMWRLRKEAVLKFCSQYHLTPSAFLFGHIHYSSLIPTPFPICNTGTFQRHFTSLVIDVYPTYLQPYKLKFGKELILQPLRIIPLT